MLSLLEKIFSYFAKHQIMLFLLIPILCLVFMSGIRSIVFHSDDKETLEIAKSKIEELAKTNKDLSASIVTVKNDYERQLKVLAELHDKELSNAKAVQEVVVVRKEKSKEIVKTIEKKNIQAVKEYDELSAINIESIHDTYTRLILNQKESA